MPLVTPGMTTSAMPPDGFMAGAGGMAGKYSSGYGMNGERQSGRNEQDGDSR